MKPSQDYKRSDNSMLADLPDNQHDLDRMKSETVTMDLPEVKDIPGQEHIRIMPLGEMADTTISSADEEGAGLLDFDNTSTGIDDEDDTDDADGDSNVMIGTEEEDDSDDDDLDGDDPDDDLLNDDEPEEDYDGEDSIAEDDEGDLGDDMDEDENDMDDDLARASSQADFAGDKIDRETTDAEISAEEISLLENSGPVERDSDTDSLNRSKLDETDFDGETLNEISSTQNVDGNDLDVPGTEMDDDDEAIGEEDEENNLYSVADTE